MAEQMDSTPQSLRAQYEAGEIDREQYIEGLCEVEFVGGEFHEYDGYTPGTADALVQAWLEDLLTEDEATRIIKRWEARGVGAAKTNG
jgi:hypothetical protein